jgi:hypothetical protein
MTYKVLTPDQLQEKVSQIIQEYLENGIITDKLEHNVLAVMVQQSIVNQNIIADFQDIDACVTYEHEMQTSQFIYEHMQHIIAEHEEMMLGKLEQDYGEK